MLVPGSNILNMAMSVLGKQSFQYYAFQSRTPNAIGQDVTNYDDPYVLTGSLQPLARSLYEQYGFDLQRNYVNVYVSQNVTDIERDVSGDKIVFNCQVYECISKTPWHGIDGWDAILCVQVPSS